MNEIKRKEKIQEIIEEDKKKKENIYSKQHEVMEVARNRVKDLRKRLGLNANKFVEGIDGFSDETLYAIEKGNSGLTLDKALKISQKYDVSLDYLFGISNFMNENEILIDKAFKMVFDPTIIIDKYDIKDVGSFKLELMVLNVNEYLIKFLFDSYKLDVDFANDELSEYDYNYKINELKDNLYEAIRNNGNLRIPHVLIPFDEVNNDINKILDKYYKLNNPDNKL